MTSPVDRFSESQNPNQHMDRLNKMVAQVNANFTSHATTITANSASIQTQQGIIDALTARIAALEAIVPVPKQ